MIKEGKLKNFSLLFLLFGFSKYPIDYRFLSGIDFLPAKQWTSSLYGADVTYTYHASSNEIKTNEIKIITQKTEKAIKDFARREGLPTLPCKDLKVLDLYFVPVSEITNRAQYMRFPFNNMKEDSIVWGIYDPLSSEHKSAVIFGNPGGIYSELTQAHELAHYWHDRFCWPDYSSKNPEELAIEFENFYSENYLKEGK